MRLPTHKLLLVLLLAVGLVAYASSALAVLQISEVRTDNSGTDTDEYFEISGTPGTDLSAYTYLVIGDAGTAPRCGVIENVTALTGFSIQADGFFCAAKTYATHALTGYDANIATMNFENGDNVTHLLVYQFTGTNGQDLDTNDDGVLDVFPWTSVIDQVALINPALTIDCSTSPAPAGTSEHWYGTVGLGPDATNTGTGNSVAAHVFRCGDTGLWKVGLFAPLGTDDTPGAVNYSCAALPPTIPTETRVPCVPFVSQTATAQIRALHATGANIHYKVNGGSTTVAAMALTGTSGDTTTYQYVLPAQGVNGTRVEYFCRAYNANPDTTQGYNQGYFVGTKNIRDLYVNDGVGRNIYYKYGVRVTGKVTAPYGLFQTVNTEYYMQDATGGINIFKYGTHTVQPALGDDITVEGALDQFNGKLELAKGGPCDTLLVDINGPGSVPTPRLTTTCDDFEVIENDLARMMLLKLPAGVDTLKANINYKVTNCHADTVNLFIDIDTGIAPFVVTGYQYLNVTGIATQYDTSSPYTAGYEIIPRYLSDIERVGTTGIDDRNLHPTAHLLQNAPNPFGRTTEIRYEVPAGAKAGEMVPVKINVFDIRGRLVKTLVDGLQSSGDHVVSLTGDVLRNAGSGIYFYRLETGGQVLTRRLLFLEQ